MSRVDLSSIKFYVSYGKRNDECPIHQLGCEFVYFHQDITATLMSSVACIHQLHSEGNFCLCPIRQFGCETSWFLIWVSQPFWRVGLLTQNTKGSSYPVSREKECRVSHQLDVKCFNSSHITASFDERHDIYLLHYLYFLLHVIRLKSWDIVALIKLVVKC